LEYEIRLNNAGKAALHNVAYKIRYSILSGLTGLLQNEMQISENLPYQISALYIEGFMGYMEKSIYGLI
jgi:hypothetical protein